ncbi:Metallo-dependent hydrolase [Aspergillus leporis]|uniref:Metallo-dependent hydrolase n=1 Tax=Aspergillus leporis TaxID=41062 RepID=A0A5N5WLZ3_9EURO|nr:Metallo-dependent hydrolase [Aspergillus leporis]
MLYIHATIITIDATRQIIEDGAIYVDNDTIADIGKTTILLQRYPHEKRYNLGGCIVVPGLVSTHIHTIQTLLRGTADNLAKETWLSERVRPLQRSMTNADAQVSVKLTIAEMLKSGTTSFLECLFFPAHDFDELCQTVQDSGIRACLSRLSLEGVKHGRWPKPGESLLSGAMKAWEKWNGAANDRIRLKRLSTASRTHGIPITIHLAESKADTEYLASLGFTPAAYAEAVGLLSPLTVLAHAVHVDETLDIPMIASSGAHISHCPTSNSKLGSGTSPVPKLLAAGVNVSLGTDGAPCNNTCDLFLEMKQAAIAHNTPENPAPIPAEMVLEMATINGAKALGLDHLIGSLEVGKKADFVALDMNKVALQPCVNPVSNVVYAATGRDVHVVVVNGQIVVEDGRLLTLDEEAILTAAKQTICEVLKKANLHDQVKPHWPLK